LVFQRTFEYEIKVNDKRSNYYKQIDFKATKNEECKTIGRKYIYPEKEADLLKRLENVFILFSKP